MPSLSPTMSKVKKIKKFLINLQGNIVEWTKKEGDQVKNGDILASVETDKAVVDFEVNEEGYLAKILKPAGAKDIELGTVKINLYSSYILFQLVAILVEEKEDIAAFANYNPNQQTLSSTPKSTTNQTSANSSSTQTTTSNQNQPHTGKIKNNKKI